MAVTRAEVAAAAGVSPAVVSYVINGGPRPVSSTTRLRVERVIAELGYRPNGVASALRRGSTRMIGLLVESPINPFFAELAEACANATVARDHTLVIGISAQSQPRDEEFLRSLMDRRVDGIIITTGRVASRAAHALEGTPIVVVDRMPDTEPLVPTVQFDNVHAGRLAVEHLRAHGHRNVACIGGPWRLAAADDRIEGWRMAMGLESVDESLLERSEFTSEGGRDAARSILGPLPRRRPRDGRPTALFVSSDVQAFGALQACVEFGLRVPEDIAIVSIDGTAISQRTSPSLTSVRQPLREIADAAISSLISPDGSTTRTTLRGNLVIGRSCGCSFDER